MNKLINAAFLRAKSTTRFQFLARNPVTSGLLLAALLSACGDSNTRLDPTGAERPLASRLSNVAGGELNLALATVGATVSASSQYSASFPANSVIQGNRG
jgi:hypothetical protein